MTYTVQTRYFSQDPQQNAPEASRPALHKLREAVGLVPNLAAAMAESPKLIEGFVALREIFQSGTFSPAEREIITLTNAVENKCNYCRAIHSTFLLKQGAGPEEVQAIREGGAPEDPKLKTLTRFARAVMRDRGNVDAATFGAFFAAGYSPAQALELLLGTAISVIANYSAHFTDPELDEALRAQA